MQALLPLAEKIAARLIARQEKITVAEGSAGGLISASLLAVPGASGYFLGGAIIYTVAARRGVAGIGDEDMKGIRAASEPYALLLARKMRDRHGADNTVFGACRKPAQQDRRETATAIPRDIPASASPARSTAPSH